MRIIFRILDQITAKFKKNTNKNISEVVIPENLQKWVEKYNRLGHRDEYLWKIYLKAKEQLDFVPVANKYRKSLQEINFLVTMYVVFIDDVADKEQNGELLDLLIDVPFQRKSFGIHDLSARSKDYLEFCVSLWNHIRREIKNFPEYEKFIQVFDFDIESIVNSIKYDWIINENKMLINYSDSLLYQVHSMKFMSITSLDMMCSASLTKKQIASIREISTHIQKMLRIGNWVSTWEREANENDFTSGVFAYSLSKNIIDLNELNVTNKQELIKKIKNAKVERKLLDSWNKSYKTTAKLVEKSEMKNFETLLNGLENLLKLELVSKGRK